MKPQPKSSQAGPAYTRPQPTELSSLSQTEFGRLGVPIGAKRVDGPVEVVSTTERWRAEVPRRLVHAHRTPLRSRPTTPGCADSFSRSSHPRSDPFVVTTGDQTKEPR